MNEIRVNVDMDPEEQLSGDMNNSIFLAGPCPRENYEDDWRKEAIEILEKLGFTGKIINPTNPLFAELREKYKDKALAVQTKWEYIAMKKASAIVFWLHVILKENIQHLLQISNLVIGMTNLVFIADFLIGQKRMNISNVDLI